MQLSKHIWTCGTPIYWDSVIEVINREWTVMPTKFKNTKTMFSFDSNETDDHNTLQGITKTLLNNYCCFTSCTYNYYSQQQLSRETGGE